jgi:hypothetical protein
MTVLLSLTVEMKGSISLPDAVLGEGRCSYACQVRCEGALKLTKGWEVLLSFLGKVLGYY